MYIRTVSPDSGQILYIDVELKMSVYKPFKGSDEAYRFTLDNIKVKETLTVDALARDIKKSLDAAGMPDDLEKALIDQYGISKEAVPDLIEYMFPLGVVPEVG